MNILIEIITKISPFLGALLGGPFGGIAATLISKALGGIDMTDPQQVADVIKNNPETIQKLKELELQLKDLQAAREMASKDTGGYKIVRPMLAVISMIAVCIDIFAIDYINNEIVEQILIVMLIILIWDIRQIYKFYFGSGEELPSLPFLNQKKK